MRLIEKDNPFLSLTRQAELLDLSRSSIYYQPIIPWEDILTMHSIDKIYTRLPFYGSRRMRDALKDDYGKIVGRDHVRRLMGLMGLEAIYPKRNTSLPAPGHQIYPYLLKNLPIAHPNHVWGTDITYLPLKQGFCYLTAILDWYSRYVLAWEISPTMETAFCVTSLRSALAQAIPLIHNSDQGAQFTANAYTNELHSRQVQISMDGKGRCMDNIFTERLWRSVKYEDVYLKKYETIDQVREGINEYFPFYNYQRRHQGINNRTPAEVYYG